MKKEFDDIVLQNGLEILHDYFPQTKPLDFSKITSIMDKADGSLISTFNHYNSLRLKSKGSLYSQQAVDALEFLNRPENETFKSDLHALTLADCTVNMEWCAPHNRIVLGYSTPKLIVLNVRHNYTGEYLSKQQIIDLGCASILDRWCDTFVVSEFADTGDAFVRLVDQMTGIEGFVITLSNGTWVKKKTHWYVALHHAKDSVNNPRRLFEAVLEEGTDDLRTLFHEDPSALQRIEEMELLVEHIYNPLVASVDAFYKDNKHLTQKEYAIKGQQFFENKGEFGLAMNKYNGRDIDVKMYLKKNYKKYGITEDETGFHTSE